MNNMSVEGSEEMKRDSEETEKKGEEYIKWKRMEMGRV